MNPEIGVVLSGGGIRAAAHIGVLQVLNENGIFPSVISAASGGAIVGALYCVGYEPRKIFELCEEHDFLKIFKIGLLYKNFTELTHLKTFLETHLLQKEFEHLLIPLYISVCNLNSRKNEIISDGHIIPYLMGSCSIPVLFRPVLINDQMYVDGGLINDLPIEPLEDKELKILGVNTCGHGYKSEVLGMRHVAERSLQMSIWNNTKVRLEKCHYALDLRDTFIYGLFDIKKSEELFNIGYNTAQKHMSQILDKLKS